MEVKIPKKSLADSLNHVERIIPNRTSNPNLSLLFIEIQKDNIILKGSNLEIDIEAKLAADIDTSEKQTFALPASVFSQIVRSLPGELVSLSFEENEMGISSGNYGTKLQLVKDFEAANIVFPESYSASIDGQVLSRLFSHVRYAAAVAEYQAIFRGLLLELGQSSTRAVATDGFRLAYYNSSEVININQEVADNLSNSDVEEKIEKIVIPAKTVDELIKLLSDEKVEFVIDNNQFSIKSDRFKMNSKLMEGSFPDYQKIIPSEFPLVISLNAAEFSSAIKRVAVMADQSANNRIGILVKDGLLQITAEGNYGRAEEELEVNQDGKDEIVLAYNAKYLIDALGPISGEVILSFSSVDQPTASVLKSAQDPNYLAMIVPLRI